jgi:hypothetical protein
VEAIEFLGEDADDVFKREDSLSAYRFLLGTVEKG